MLNVAHRTYKITIIKSSREKFYRGQYPSIRTNFPNCENICQYDDSPWISVVYYSWFTYSWHYTRADTIIICWLRLRRCQDDRITIRTRCACKYCWKWVIITNLPYSNKHIQQDDGFLGVNLRLSFPHCKDVVSIVLVLALHLLSFRKWLWFTHRKDIQI